MMKRRAFGKKVVGGVLGAGMAGGLTAGAAPAQGKRAHPPRRNTMMHVGADYHSVAGGPRADITGKANLEYNLRHGVRHLTATLRNVSADGAWDADELKRMKDNCDK